MCLFTTEAPLCSVTTMRRKLQPQLFHLHDKGSGDEEVRGEISLSPYLSVVHSLLHVRFETNSCHTVPTSMVVLNESFHATIHRSPTRRRSGMCCHSRRSSADRTGSLSWRLRKSAPIGIATVGTLVHELLIFIQVRRCRAAGVNVTSAPDKREAGSWSKRLIVSLIRPFSHLENPDLLNFFFKICDELHTSWEKVVFSCRGRSASARFTLTLIIIIKAFLQYHNIIFGEHPYEIIAYR